MKPLSINKKIVYWVLYSGSCLANIRTNDEVLKCFDDASKRYNVPREILWSIASVESKFKYNAINKNSNGTYDLGMMQVNTIWKNQLLKIGITENMLFDPCQNIYVGTWILAQNIKKYGYGWEAIQRYNGRDTQLKYAHKVYKMIVQYNPKLIK